MGGRRIYHARGKVLGGSSTINGMIFQRGNPLDLERWAADPGMAVVELRALPAVLQADGDVPRGRRRVPRRRRAARCSNAARRRTRSSAPSSRRCSRPGYPLTDDVNGYRQEGFAKFDRNIRRGRRLSAARAYLHPVMRRPNLTVETRAHVTRILFEGTRAVGVSYRTGAAAARATCAAARSILCGGAINSPQLLQLSGVGDAARAAARSASTSCTTCRASARTCRTTSRSTSSTARSSRSRWHRDAATRNAPRVGPRVAAPAQRPGRDEPLRGRRVRALERRRRLPEPDVPLPAARGPLRRLDAGRRATATRCTSGRCTRTRAARCTSARRDPLEKPALRFNYLSTEQDRREWVEAIRVARSILTQPAFDAFNDGELSPGPSVETRRGDPRLGGARRRDRAAPLVHLQDGHRRAVGRRPADACACTASTACAWSTPRSFPYVTNGNIYAPVMMVAEKAADLILGNTPLAPSTAEFFRREPAGRARPRPRAAQLESRWSNPRGGSSAPAPVKRISPGGSGLDLADLVEVELALVERIRAAARRRARSPRRRPPRTSRASRPTACATRSAPACTGTRSRSMRTAAPEALARRRASVARPSERSIIACETRARMRPSAISGTGRTWRSTSAARSGSDASSPSSSSKPAREPPSGPVTQTTSPGSAPSRGPATRPGRARSPRASARGPAHVTPDDLRTVGGGAGVEAREQLVQRPGDSREAGRARPGRRRDRRPSPRDRRG